MPWARTLLGAFAAVGGFSSEPTPAAIVESGWQDDGAIAAVSVVTEPVTSSQPSPLTGLADDLSPIVEVGAPAPSIAAGGGHGSALPGRAMAASDLVRSISSLGRGRNGTGGGDGEGAGDGKGSGFFGRRITGEKIVYVVDSSQSMNHPHPGIGKTRMGRVKLELVNSVRSLAATQKFYIVFFNERPIAMPSDRLVEASEAAKLQYLRWMIDVKADGKTDPALALLLALRLNPDTIYFLTDGEFRPTIVREVATSNRKGVKIHTVGFTQDRGEKLLQMIAEQNGGTYQYIPPDEQVAEAVAAP